MMFEVIWTIAMLVLGASIMWRYMQGKEIVKTETIIMDEEAINNFAMHVMGIGWDMRNNMTEDGMPDPLGYEWFTEEDGTRYAAFYREIKGISGTYIMWTHKFDLQGDLVKIEQPTISERAKTPSKAKKSQVVLSREYAPEPPDMNWN